MNYFLTQDGIEPTGMDAHNLFLHMKFGVLGNSEVKTFNFFKEIIELPFVVFRHQNYALHHIHRDYNVIGTGQCRVEEIGYRVLDAYANGKCSLIYFVTHDNEFGDVVRMYTIAQADFDIMMRPVVIDEILKTL